MSKFTFKNSQRVLLPATIAGPNVQAVITSRTEYAWREPRYDLQWLLNDTYSEDNKLRTERHILERSVLVYRATDLGADRSEISA